MAEKLERLKSRLSTGLEKHYEDLSRLAPGIVGYALRPTEPLASDPILLPSRFKPDEVRTFRAEALLEAERKLRIGHAHDVVNLIREALGIRSYMTRHALKSNGYRENSYAQHSIRRAEANVNTWREVYKQSWKALERLGMKGADLCGLQKLEQEHLVLLGDWLENERYRSKASNDRLPWIWTIAAITTDDLTDEAQAEQVRKWNIEGASSFGLGGVCNANVLSSATFGMGPRKSSSGKMERGNAPPTRGVPEDPDILPAHR